MSDISTNSPPQHSTFGMVIGNTSRETPSTLTLASTTHGDRIPSTTPGAEPPRDAKDSGSARSHPTHVETSSSNRP